MNYLKLIYLLLFAVGITTCRDAEIQPKDYPYVVTTDATNIDANGVTLNAVVKKSGNQAITDYGFIITFSDKQTEYSLNTALKTNSFEIRIQSDLDSGEVYSYKAYMRTKQNLVLGNDIEFISKGSGNVVISDIVPKEGFANTKVKITGTNFSNNTNKVFLNNLEIPVELSTPSSIEFVIPSNLKPMEYEVKVISGKRIIILPQKFKISQTLIYLVSPLSGRPGQEISITGENLLRGGLATVYLGGLASGIVNDIYMSETLIKIKVPLDKNYLLFDTPLDVIVQVGNLKTTYSKKFILKKTWESKKPISSSAPLKLENGFTYQNRVYVFDANNGYMHRYDPILDTWEMIQNSRLNSDNYDGTLYIPFNNKFYRVGGYDHIGNLIKTFYIYNLDNNTWSTKATLPFSFKNASHFILNNTIYIITSEKQLWKCNFENNSFQRLNDFPDQPTNDFIATFTANERIYAIQYGKTWQYNSENDTWTYMSFNHFTYDHYGKKPICINYNNTGYFFEQYIFLYKYDFISNKMNLVSLYPGVNTESLKSLFVNNNKLYILGYESLNGIYNPNPYMFAFQDL